MKKNAKYIYLLEPSLLFLHGHLNRNEKQLNMNSKHSEWTDAVILNAILAGAVSLTSRNFSGGINPFVSSTWTRFKLWNLAVILPSLISETYKQISFTRQADHSFKNCFSGPDYQSSDFWFPGILKKSKLLKAKLISIVGNFLEMLGILRNSLEFPEIPRKLGIHFARVGYRVIKKMVWTQE